MEGHEEDGGGAEEAGELGEMIMIQHWMNFCFFGLRDGPFWMPASLCQTIIIAIVCFYMHVCPQILLDIDFFFFSP